MKKLLLLGVLVLVAALMLPLASCSSSEAEFQAALKEKDDEIESLISDLAAVQTELDAAEDLLDTGKAEQEALTDERNAIQDQLDTLLAGGPTTGATLLEEAANIVHLLHTKNFTELSLYVDPAVGLRVTPYQHVDVASDVLLSANDVSNLESYPETTWGITDGIGDPIELSGIDYFEQFIYDADFEHAPHIGQNTVLSAGNTINNIQDVYPGDAFVEFYYAGFNPEYSGMDWTSLTLVLRSMDGQWHLVALVHGQWTI